MNALEPAPDDVFSRGTTGFGAAAVAISHPVRRVVRRVRLQRFMNAFAVGAVGALGVCGAALGLGAAELISAEAARWAWYGAAAAPLLFAVVGAARRVSPLGAASRLDQTHGLHSRFRSALEFAGEPAEVRTPFMHAAVLEAGQHVDRVEPSRAAPLRWPKAAWPAAILAAALFGLSVGDPAPPDPVASVEPQLGALLLHEDDLAAFEDNVDPLLELEGSERIRAAAEEFNQLVEDLAERSLDRTEALRRIEVLERRLSDARAADADAMEEALRRLGQSLRTDVTEAASDALRDADAARAHQELRSLAERLRGGEVDRRRLNELRRALRRASREDSSVTDRDVQRARRERDRLLARQRERSLNSRERRLLNRRRRELERLERNAAQEAEQRRQLERLRRELSQAAQDLERNAASDAADSLERGAEDLNRAAGQQLNESQRQELARQLDQLRELMRRARAQGQSGQGSRGGQSGQGPRGQGQRMDRFVLRAQGQGEGEGQGTPLMVPGSGGDSRGQAGGQPGSGSRAGSEGSPGPNGEQRPTKALRLGGQGGDAILEIPGTRQARSGSGGGRGAQGPGAGTGTDDSRLSRPTDIDSSRRNVQVDGEENDRGPSRSEVILSAADRGFSARRYQRVYTDYSNHAEEVLERDEIPGGYRFYVRRYFQLIRPREAEASGRTTPVRETEENGEQPR